MKMRKPSRILNERSVLMGLDFTDLVGLALLLVVFQVILKPFNLEFFALVLTLISGCALSPIRMRFRRKIIRDAILYLIAPKRVERFKNVSRDN